MARHQILFYPIVIFILSVLVSKDSMGYITAQPKKQFSLNEFKTLLTQSPDDFKTWYFSTPHSAITEGPEIGILGDSVATGAATNPNLYPSYTSIASHIVSAQIFHFVTYGSFIPPHQANFNIGVDSPLLAFGQILGRILGSGYKQIMNLAKDGEKAYRMGPQIEDLVRVRGERFGEARLPRAIFATFNANDMCKTAVLNRDLNELETSYYKDLQKGYNILLSQKVPPQGTDFFMFSNINATQVLTQPSILGRQTLIAGQPATCHDLRTPYFVEHPEHEKIQKLSTMCSGILGLDLNDSESLRKMNGVYHTLLKAQNRALADHQSEALEKNIRLHYVDSIADLLFEGSEVGNDCFHPSFKGQMKIAAQVIGQYESVLNSIRTNP